MKFIEPGFILQLAEQPIVSAGAEELLVSGVCFKCMKEVGVSAQEIIELQVSLSDRGSLAALRNAGCSMRVAAALRSCCIADRWIQPGGLDVARDQLHLAIRPPLTYRTLFDSQLKAAGSSAGFLQRRAIGLGS